MVFRDSDKLAIKQNQYTTIARISISGTDTVLTEDNYINEFTYEDYRYVPDNGFIGQFVERLLDGKLLQLPSDINLENADINLQIGIVNGLDGKTTFYNYGNFLVTNVTEEDTTGIISFQASDYTKKFNIPYVDSVSYPCLALEYLDNVCTQVGVELEHNGYAYCYAPNDIIKSGVYYIQTSDEKYYKFTIPKAFGMLDSLMYIEDEHKMILKTLDDDFNITKTELALVEVEEVEEVDHDLIEFNRVRYVDFINNDFVIMNNQYTENDICREVIKDLAKLGYTWARVGSDNKLHMDFKKKSIEDINIYDKLTTDEYYTSTRKPIKFGPVNKVLIGMSQVEGENIYSTSEDYTEDTECAIKIYDNRLTYTADLRRIAIHGCEELFGVEYTALDINSIGHPWLEGDELIELTNVDKQILYTYPFDRQINYKGYLTTNISSNAMSIVQSMYDSPIGLADRLSKTEIIVDKNNRTVTEHITNVEEKVDKTSKEFNDFVTNQPDYLTKDDEVIQTITTKLNRVDTSTQSLLEFQKTIDENGVNKVDTTTGFKFDEEGLSIDKTGAKTNTKLDEKALRIIDKTSSSRETLLYSGYIDEEISGEIPELDKYKGGTVTYSKNLDFSQYLASKNWRIEEVEDDNLGIGLGFFYTGE